MTASTTRTIKKPELSIVLQRIAGKDCVDAYENFIWALARKFTRSREEAAAAAQEIFIDIRRCAERADQTPSAENLLLAQIARRRLIKYLE